MMAERNAAKNYDFLQILNLQITAKALENEALMRYISNPGNFAAIGKAFERALETLVQLPPHPILQCPPDYVHCSNCKCCSIWMRPLEESYDDMIHNLEAKIGQLTMEQERRHGPWTEGRD